MKIALINHGTAADWGGGDSVQIKELGKRLTAWGHDVSYINSDTPDVAGFDIAHIFNCRIHTSFTRQIRSCRRSGVKRIVVTPIWISIGRALWGSRGTFMALSKIVDSGGFKGIHELKMIRERKGEVSLDGGRLDSAGNGTYQLDWLYEVGEMINSVDAVITNSWLELKAIQSDLRFKGSVYDVAYYGADAKTFLDSEEGRFREHYEIDGRYIIQAGRIEPGKNQAMLCWALRNSQIKIVLVGSTRHWPAYGRLCQEISGDRLRIIDHMPQDLLASAYAGSDCHCLPSWMDTCGLVSLEAALAGVPIVGSTFGHELEYLKNDATLVDPGDETSILAGVERAIKCGRNRGATIRLKERVMEEFSWEKNARINENMYKMII